VGGETGNARKHGSLVSVTTYLDTKMTEGFEINIYLFSYAYELIMS
jgi:hypothetical protein